MSNICKILSDSICDKHFIPGDLNSKGRQAHRYGPIYDLLFMHRLTVLVEILKF